MISLAFLLSQQRIKLFFIKYNNCLIFAGKKECVMQTPPNHIHHHPSIIHAQSDDPQLAGKSLARRWVLKEFVAIKQEVIPVTAGTALGRTPKLPLKEKVPMFQISYLPEQCVLSKIGPRTRWNMKVLDSVVFRCSVAYNMIILQLKQLICTLQTLTYTFPGIRRCSI